MANKKGFSPLSIYIIVIKRAAHSITKNGAQGYACLHILKLPPLQSHCGARIHRSSSCYVAASTNGNSFFHPLLPPSISSVVWILKRGGKSYLAKCTDPHRRSYEIFMIPFVILGQTGSTFYLRPSSTRIKFVKFRPKMNPRRMRNHILQSDCLHFKK